MCTNGVSFMMYPKHPPQCLALCSCSMQRNVSVTWGKLNTARQLSLKVTEHIHCFNWKCLKPLVHLRSLPYLKIIPSSYLWFTVVHSIAVTMVVTPAQSDRVHTVEGITHLSTEDKILCSKTSICRRMLKHQAADEPFLWTLGSL